MKRIARLTAVLSIAIAAFGTTSAVADVKGSQIETPQFSLGSVHGQQGWTSAGTQDQEVDITPGFLNGDLGAQALRISNAVATGGFGDQTFSPSLVDEAGETAAASQGQSGGNRQKQFDASFKFASNVNALQTGAAVGISPDRGDGQRMSFVRIRDEAAGLAVDFVDVPSPTLVAGHVDFVTQTGIATGLARNAVHKLRIVVDFVDGADNDVVKVYVDGTLEATGETWENYYRNDTEQAGNLNKVPTTDSLIFRTNVAAPANVGNGFLFDDVRLESSSGTGGVGPQGPAGPRGPAGPAGSGTQDSAACKAAKSRLARAKAKLADRKSDDASAKKIAKARKKVKAAKAAVAAAC